MAEHKRTNTSPERKNIMARIFSAFHYYEHSKHEKALGSEKEYQSSVFVRSYRLMRKRKSIAN